MLARKQELNTQLQQLIDALLLAVSLWVAYVLRFYATSWFHLAYMVRSTPELSMAFRGDMPFGPIMLDLQGFYQSPLYLYIRQRAGHGGFREPVLLAGTPEDIAALEQSFSPEQKTWSRWSIGSTSQDSRLVTWCNGCIDTPFPG